MNDDRKAAILINDLDTIEHLIEDMPAVPEYTDALIGIQAAKKKIAEGRTRLHQKALRDRHDT